MADEIFISYRRVDSAGIAGRLCDRLRSAFTPDAVFMDVSSIQPGTDFIAALTSRIERCKVCLVFIGREWVSASENGRRRIDNETDHVRFEVQSVLDRAIPVVPVLVDGASLPSMEALPDKLRGLAQRQAVRLSHEQFDIEAGALISSLSQYVSSQTAQPQLAEAPPSKAQAIFLTRDELLRVLKPHILADWLGRRSAIQMFDELNIRARREFETRLRRQHKIPAAEHIGAVVVQFGGEFDLDTINSNSIEACISICESGIYYWEGTIMQGVISFEEFLRLPVSVSNSGLSVGGVVLGFHGLERALHFVQRSLDAVRVAVRNELRYKRISSGDRS